MNWYNHIYQLKHIIYSEIKTINFIFMFWPAMRVKWLFLCISRRFEIGALMLFNRWRIECDAPPSLSIATNSWSTHFDSITASQCYLSEAPPVFVFFHDFILYFHVCIKLTVDISSDNSIKPTVWDSIQNQVSF